MQRKTETNYIEIKAHTEKKKYDFLEKDCEELPTVFSGSSGSKFARLTSNTLRQMYSYSSYVRAAVDGIARQIAYFDISIQQQDTSKKLTPKEETLKKDIDDF